MAELRLEGANKSFGDTAVLRDIDLAIADGEFVVVVGPSGCGKSTLLRAIAGLEDLDSGLVAIGDTIVDRLPPSQRGIAMVFQSYALYPHLSCRENIAFALRMAKRPKVEIDAAVARAADILGLHDLLERKPAALSGGQRQRVAIGRAIVRQPDVFLFDEPLSNLDAALRVRMRYEFAALHRTLGTTTVYVTHDQVEAMTLADRIVLMRDGRIEQTGSPDDLYQRPANVFVAGFLGSPQMNLLGGAIAALEEGRAGVTLDSGERIVAPMLAGIAPGTRVTIGIRPDEIERGGPGSAGCVLRTVNFVERLGGAVVAHLGTPGSPDALVWQTRDDADIVEGATVTLRFASARLHVFDEHGLAIR